MEATIFYMTGCPYCSKAKQALAELLTENPDYGQVVINWINETTEPEKAEGYDYYYVPTVFFGKKKLYEAHPGDDAAFIKESLRKALDEIIGE